ncbi:36.4 kDa proline-rich protein-like [Zingiber officinale]|uniref:36.4 kDa proline-rich protein-like n=1 Tax=Zingiber officinale TaxID=94328 RepID=UPI001C4BC69F|nr:36.4 kDa proline-rich protein-like [Zingiber officinale]
MGPALGLLANRQGDCPVINSPPVGGSTLSPTPPPVINPPPASFPVDSLKVWARVDLFGGRVHTEVGDPAANQFSQMPQGIVDPEDAVCLCAAIKLKLLNGSTSTSTSPSSSPSPEAKLRRRAT